MPPSCETIKTERGCAMELNERILEAAIMYAGVTADAIPGPTAMAGSGCAKYQKWGALK